MRARERVLELRNVLPFIIWLVALAAALNSGWVMAYRILYLFTLLIVLGLIWSAGAVYSLSVEREPHQRAVHVGDTIAEQVVIRNRSLLPQLWVVLEDASDLPLHTVRQVLSYISPRSRRQFVLRTPAVRRGRYRLGPSLLTGGDPFGIFRSKRRVGRPANLIVYPRVWPLHSFDLLSGALEAATSRPRVSSDPTTDVSSVRDYYPGDELRRIHWLSSARHGRLISKEFEHRPGGDVWVVLDLQRAVQAGSLLPVAEPGEPQRIAPRDWPALEPATEEYAVSMAASIAAHFLARDRAVGFVAHGAHRTLLQPDRGDRHLNRIYDLLAVIRADGRLPLDRLLEREAPNFRRQDTVAVVTASDNSAWVAAAHALALRGLRVLAVVIDRATFDGGEPSDALRGLLTARRLPFCMVELGQRPDETVCQVG